MGRGGEGANKVLQPAQSVRLRASIKVCRRRRVAAEPRASSVCKGRGGEGMGGEGWGGEGRGQIKSCSQLRL